MKYPTIAFLSAAIAATALLLGPTAVPKPTLAGTCASKCGPKALQFRPGEQVEVEIVNLTSNLIRFQKVYGTDTVPLSPGQSLRVRQGDGTAPNISVMFWDETGLSLKAILSKPSETLLRIQLRPGYEPPGDSSVYIRNDGRVQIF